MRPQHSMYMQHSGGGHPGGPRNAMGAGGPGPYGGPMGGSINGPQRPPNVQVNPEGMPSGSQQEWRHMMLQQQNMSFGGQNAGGPMRQQGFNNSGRTGNLIYQRNLNENNLIDFS